MSLNPPPMRPTDVPTEAIQRLLQQGLDCYGRNEVEAAVDCWQQVLALQPGNAIARDYLESAGADAANATGDQMGADIIDFGRARAHLVAERNTTMLYTHREPANDDRRRMKLRLACLLRDRRYHDALRLLTAALERSPNDDELARGVELLRQRLRMEAAPPMDRMRLTPPPLAVKPAGLSQGPAKQVRGQMADAAVVESGRLADEEYGELFRRATEAYMLRNFRMALALYEQCAECRPNDSRASHNVQALRKRLGQE